MNKEIKNVRYGTLRPKGAHSPFDVQFLLNYIPKMLAVYIQYKILFQNVHSPTLHPKGSQKLSNRHIFFLIVGKIYPIQNKLYLYSDLRNTCQLYSYIGIGYVIPTIGGNVSVRGFLCAQECTFCNIYTCIGYMLPTFGENISVGGFLCALRAQS